MLLGLESEVGIKSSLGQLNSRKIRVAVDCSQEHGLRISASIAVHVFFKRLEKSELATGHNYERQFQNLS